MLADCFIILVWSVPVWSVRNVFCGVASCTFSEGQAFCLETSALDCLTSLTSICLARNRARLARFFTAGARNEPRRTTALPLNYPHSQQPEHYITPSTTSTLPATPHIQTHQSPGLQTPQHYHFPQRHTHPPRHQPTSPRRASSTRYATSSLEVHTSSKRQLPSQVYIKALRQQHIATPSRSQKEQKK